MEPHDHPLVDQMVMITTVDKVENSTFVKIAYGPVTSWYEPLEEGGDFHTLVHFYQHVHFELRFEVNSACSVILRRTDASSDVEKTASASRPETLRAILCPRTREKWVTNVTELRIFLHEQLEELGVPADRIDPIVERITLRTTSLVSRSAI